MLRVYLELIIMVTLWGFSFVIVDIAVEIIPPLSIALYRFVIASCTFLLFDFYFRLKKKEKINSINNDINKYKFSRNDWILMVLASFSGISIFFLVNIPQLK